MAQHQSNSECQLICWGIAGVAGLLAMVLLGWMADFSPLQAIFTGGLIGFVLGLVLSLFICSGQTAKAVLADEARKPAARYAAEAAENKTSEETANKAGAAPTVESDSAAQADTTEADVDGSAPLGTMASVSAVPAESENTKVKPSKDLPGEKELAARKGEWKYEGDTDATAAPAAESKSSAAATAPVASTPAAASQGDAPTDDDRAPELMDAPRPEGRDNLKLISGVGPKLEETLNEMGIWHFDQVAKWGEKEIAWVDSRLRFKGRIERDDWMSQAKILAEGGETEFSRKKKS